MLTALFSVTFTSCIDNEVSPLVEAIYEAQADLIAAQAGVQNAEAALLLAQANAENAQATYTASLTAQVNAETAGIIADNAYEAARRTQWLLELVAETNLAVAEAQHDLQLAQAQFNIDMAALTAQMQAAGANLAVGYAYDYMYAMQVVNSLKSEKLTKQGQLALAELYLKAGTPETTWALYLAGLNTKLSAEQAKVTAAQAAIVTLNTAKANPTAIETQLAGLKTQKATLEARKVQLVGLIATAEQNRLAAQKAVDDAVVFMASPSGPYATAKASLATWKAAYTADSLAIKTQTANVATHTAAIANYAATTTTLTNAKNDAVAVVGQNTTLPYTGLKGSIQTIVNTLGNNAVPFASPIYSDPIKTGAIALTEYGKLYNAELALAIFENDFAQLTASYNLAANNLVSATNTYNTTGWPALILSAQTDLTTAQNNLTTAKAYYDAKKAIFEANPTGLTWFDQTTPLGGSVAETSPAFPNTRIGIHTDAIATSYAYVTAWTESPAGTWTATTLSTGMVTAIPGTASAYTGPVVSATMPSVLATTGFYVELEADDLSETNVALFNDASTKLGVEVTAPFYTGTSPRVYAADFTAPPVTTYQALWNAAKLVSQLQYQSTASAAILADAQEAYNYQKELFETGLATRVTLEAAVAAQLVIIGADSTPGPASGLLGQLEALQNQLGNTAFGTPISTDVAKTTGTGSTLGSDYYMVGAVKTLTAYALKWNAELALVKHTTYTLVQHQADLATAQAALTTATREAAEDLIFIAKYTADLAALQAQYDALIVTPLYAALNVTLVNATQAKAALVAEDAAATISISSLTTLIAALQTTVPDYTALIAAQNLIITNANDEILATQIAISKGNVDLAALQANVQNLKDQIAVLTIRIANAQAIADKFKALMTAALAS